MRFLVLTLLALSMLAACASLSEDECRAGNWREIGQKDGADGRTADYIRTHVKACADYGIRPNAILWEQGRQEGLKVYCTVSNAYREGTRGHRLAPVCPAEDLARLARANAQGLELFDLKSEIRDTEHEIRDLRTELAALPPDAPERRIIISQISFLELHLLQLRARYNRLLRYRY